MKRLLPLTLAALAAAPGLAFAAGGAIEGAVAKRSVNITAIGMFLFFVLATLVLTAWAARRTKSRSFTAAVLIEALSAPASRRLRISSTVRTPPPTVSGMKQASAVRCTTSSNMPRFS